MFDAQGKMTYWKSLQRSLTDRADGLMEYVDTLLADSTRSDDGFERALKICRLYTRVFVDVLNHDLEHAEGEQECREYAEAHLKAFMSRYAKIDRWLSRGSQSAVPRALQTICRRQFDAARLPQYEPVLTVGAPDSFEVARTPDLHKLLFESLRATTPETRAEVEELAEGRSLAIISVPYIEGTRTLWYPITVGHEICHLRLNDSTIGIELADLTSRWIEGPKAEYKRAVEQLEESPPERHLTPTLIASMLTNRLRYWAIEVVCDLNAVRLFGPAGVSAISEFISMASDSPEEATAASTHPPSAVRLEVMLRGLRALGFSTGEIDQQIKAWPEPPATEVTHDAVTALLIQALIEAADDLIDFTFDWGFKLKNDGEFEAIVDRCVEDLLDGVPPGTHVPTNGGDRWTEISTAHVVNAAWQAREHLVTQAGPQAAEAERRMLLKASDIAGGEQRLHLDRLAGKAIDSIELARLWRDTSEVIAPGWAKARQPLPLSPSRDLERARGGVLSSVCIADRLQRNAADLTRLLVTPLFSDAVQEAGVDLRLGPDFIVFRHSATAAFDPLSRAQDPRMVQERVTKSWGEQFVLHPNELVLAATLEYLVIPSDLSAQVITRSSYGRLGLMTATAVQIQPGSRGCVTLELQNQGETPIVLWPGARVAQLILWSIIDPVQPRPAKYWFPTGPEFSKAHDDDEAVELAELGTRMHARLSEANESLATQFAGSVRDCNYFADTAEAQGVADVTRPPDSSPTGLNAHCEFSVDAQILTRVLQRWGAAQQRGITVTRTPGEDKVLISSSNDVEHGMIEFVGSDEGHLASAYVESKDPDAVLKALEALVVHPGLMEAAAMPV
jgi:deoxycytidine triphosphate deaminase